mmetsp:Transcript_4200/g.11841  ORF Transcript_4200/g.11841 Transcript_4200/m.11841 type:complete len:247 (-) Transcript_4200:9-749(-)
MDFGDDRERNRVPNNALDVSVVAYVRDRLPRKIAGAVDDHAPVLAPLPPPIVGRVRPEDQQEEQCRSGYGGEGAVQADLRLIVLIKVDQHRDGHRHHKINEKHRQHPQWSWSAVVRQRCLHPVPLPRRVHQEDALAPHVDRLLLAVAPHVARVPVADGRLLAGRADGDLPRLPGQRRLALALLRCTARVGLDGHGAGMTVSHRPRQESGGSPRREERGPQRRPARAVAPRSFLAQRRSPRAAAGSS